MSVLFLPGLAVAVVVVNAAIVLAAPMRAAVAEDGVRSMTEQE
ncbi:hypothetical protein [Nocardia noduli]|nr:hypothetical protein [Nocardia noduli]